LRGAALGVVAPGGSRELTEEDCGLATETASLPRVVVLNKSDLQAALPGGQHFGAADAAVAIEISAQTGAGLENLVAAIANVLTTAGGGNPFLGVPDKRDQLAVTNVRHADLLERARAAVLRATEALAGEVSEEFPLLDLQEAGQALQEITGRRTSDDLLHHIFAKFCIGK